MSNCILKTMVIKKLYLINDKQYVIADDEIGAIHTYRKFIQTHCKDNNPAISILQLIEAKIPCQNEV